MSGDGRVVAFETTEDLATAGGPKAFRAIGANVSVDPPNFFQISQSRAPAPAISQDGARTTFASSDNPLGTNTDGNSEIFLYDGAKLVQLTNTVPDDVTGRASHGNFLPSISDDGRFIAFSSNRDLVNGNADGNLEAFVLDAQTNTFTQLTNSSPLVAYSDVKISGDASSVVYIRHQGSSLDLLLQSRLDPSNVLTLVSDAPGLALTYGRAISDDGKRVVWSEATAVNSTQVFLYDGRNNLTKQVTNLGTRTADVPLHPTISGNGNKITFSTRRSFLGNSDGGVDLYAYDIGSATFARITAGPSNATAEVLSSMNDEGSLVVFNYPRVLTGVSDEQFANNSEIYVATTPAPPAFGSLTILNGASLGHEPGVIKAVAPNSIAIAKGSALAFANSQPKPSTMALAGTKVTVNGRAAELLFISPAQVNFVVPGDTEIGEAQVVVTNADGFQSRGLIGITRAAPAIFTVSGDGVGEGIVLNADTLVTGPFDPTDGQLHLAIFSTGLRNSIDVLVTAAGRTLQTESIMPSPDLPGLDEIHVSVPRELRGVGTVELIVQANGRVSNTALTSFAGNSIRDIVINEFLADPPGATATEIVGDANHDGTRSASQDEFLELFNTTTRDIDISGYEILTKADTTSADVSRHTFASGTILPSCSAIIVFGGGHPDPGNAVFGDAQIVTASSGAITLNNSIGAITVRDAAKAVVTFVNYGGGSGIDAANNQSITRSPDVFGPLVQHLVAAGGIRVFSPGTKLTGEPFSPCTPPVARIEISPLFATLDLNQQQQFLAHALDANGNDVSGVIFKWISSDVAVGSIDSKGLASAVSPGVTEIKAVGRGVSSSAALLKVNEPPALAIRDVAQVESDLGASMLRFEVILSAPAPAGGVTFTIETQDEAATTNSGDYVARSLSNQVIAEGQTTYVFEVNVNGDKLVELDEAFLVNISSVFGATIADGQAQGTILNDDVPNLVISQVYPGGNNGGATYRNDFVELFNRGNTIVDFSVTPYSIQYAGATASFGAANTRTELRSGRMMPGQYFLIQQAGGTTNGVALPLPDAVGNIAMSGTAGKVALVLGVLPVVATACPGDDATPPTNPSGNNIVDFVGYGNGANCFEGAAAAVFSTSTAGSLDPDARSVVRTISCRDTNNNVLDFINPTTPPVPRNSSTTSTPCP